MSESVRILLVDDDEDDFLLTREMIREADRPFVMEWASSYGAGAREIEEGRYDVYLIDYRLGQGETVWIWCEKPSPRSVRRL